MRNRVRAGRLVAVAAAGVLGVTGLAGTAEANPYAPNVGYGYANVPAAVTCVQQFYNHFTPSPPIAVDGRFGPETYAAVKRLQSWVNVSYAGQFQLQVDGIFGKRSGDALISIARGDWRLAEHYVSQCAYALPTTRNL
ncbi:peptidoglycan-binding domain-containing protein [Streptomyces sp. NPDC005017]|uniref:peptidoglycan-binding domain-containing protein n=1 Tax=Streptomyces sp. NPDC005017 TaxID=3364706 RepID=UPI0036BC9D7E